MASEATNKAQIQGDALTTDPLNKLNYNSYLKIQELTNLQQCMSSPAHHDETLFIVIHQAYELWFKLILHEMETVFSLLNEGKVRKATFYIKRITSILKLLVEQIHILETMKPKDFLGFRYNLNPASGFQSSQFREIEFATGLKDERLLEHFKGDATAYDALKKRMTAPSLSDVFYRLLNDNGFSLPLDDPSLPESEREERQQKRISQLIKIYDDSDQYADLHDLAEALIYLDELIFLWRTHHVTVVERIIGFKRGTGGSEGVGYLRSTLSKRAFPDLWKLRTHLTL